MSQELEKLKEDLFINEKNIDIVKKYDVFKNWKKEKEPYMKGIPMMFMTSTRMNLSTINTNRDSYFALMSVNMPEILRTLSNHYTITDAPTISTSDGIIGNFLNNIVRNNAWQQNQGIYAMENPQGVYLNPYSSSPFMKLLNNAFLGLDGKDLSAKTTDVGESFYGYKQTLSGPYIDSVVGDIVTVRYAETKNLPIIHLHKLWMEYRENVGRGLFLPYNDVRDNNEIDFVSSIFYFVLDRDMETILYYSKYTGVVPISNPYSALTSSIGSMNEIPDIAIDYSYSYKEDLNPQILMDFNLLCNYEYNDLSGDKNTSKYVSIPNRADYEYDPEYDKLYDSPLITKERTNGDSITPKYKFKLIFQ